MTIDKIRLKKLAEAATRGPWCWDKGEDPRPHTYGIATDADPECMVVNQDFGIEMKEDAYFIAAACPTTVLALLAEIERLDRESQNLSNQLGQCDRDRRAFRAERDQLKAENEELRKALGEISGQVDGNIRCAVRDVVNCRGDVQDIYGYCDNIDEIIAAAMAKEAAHD
ncbi:ead/Ea22-like family protein [Pseudomonas fulva]|uniref:ead/Ea22-like family protein n=1 Tax=Pseudomonas fulva TaxID=47880 RepID=UPI00247FCC3B|nr:ead/Ea22-like family protein [Pseudomonas fulva]